jgi:hypothetical protein
MFQIMLEDGNFFIEGGNVLVQLPVEGMHPEKDDIQYEDGQGEDGV